VDYVSFHLTRAGRQFLEQTMPRLVEQVARLNANLERLLERESARSEHSDADAAPAGPAGPGDATTPT